MLPFKHTGTGIASMDIYREDAEHAKVVSIFQNP